MIFAVLMSNLGLFVCICFSCQALHVPMVRNIFQNAWLFMRSFCQSVSCRWCIHVLPWLQTVINIYKRFAFKVILHVFVFCRTCFGKKKIFKNMNMFRGRERLDPRFVGLAVSILLTTEDKSSYVVAWNE